MSASAPVASTASAQSTGFDQFDLHALLVRGVKAAGFDRPRPIQAEAIPAGLAGRDVLGLAQTGTGKTAAFALPLLDHLLDGPGAGPRALVLAPTRELATQIASEIETLAKFTKLRLVTVFGGTPVRSQVRGLARKPDVVVGCPGRVLDLVQQGVLKLGHVETFVLDEADHMFDMGFLPDVRRITGRLPEDRQNLLFAATMPRELRRLVDDLLEDPHVVELADTAPAATIDHALYLVREDRKRELLERMLAGDDCRSVIVFSRTKHRARRLADQLCKAGHNATALQGNMSQAQRDRAMRGFRARRYDILVATDIAARGIDVSNVSHVINYDVPNTAEAYTHRIGRTGRSERQGVACTFVTGNDRRWVQDTERTIGFRIPRREVEGFEHDAEPAGTTPSGSGGPRRPGKRATGRRRKSSGELRRTDGGRGHRASSRPRRRNGSPKAD